MYWPIPVVAATLSVAIFAPGVHADPNCVQDAVPDLEASYCLDVGGDPTWSELWVKLLGEKTGVVSGECYPKYGDHYQDVYVAGQRIVGVCHQNPDNLN